MHTCRLSPELSALLIVPVDARVMALAGLVRLLQLIDELRVMEDHALRVAGIVACIA